MKPDLFFVLENSTWPVFLVEGSGVIRRANEAAVSVFGNVICAEATQLSAIWSSENELTPDQFLSRGERAGLLCGIKFQVKGGASVCFLCNISSGCREGEKFHLFQLFPESILAPGPGAPPSPRIDPAPTAPAAIHSSEILSLEASLAQKQKLDCALQLTRTVALDFNNTLTGILGHTSLVLSRIEPTNPVRASLLEIEKAAEKAAEIAHDLAAFSWQDKEAGSMKAGNLNELLYSTVELFQNPSSNNVLWSLQLESKLLSANFDAPKMQQAFVKILDNAIEALGPEGRIIVRTRNIEISESLQDGLVRLAPGRYVCAEIADSGCGMVPEILPRIFEPFFTTKETPKHRGLGLALVYGFVTNHRGNVVVSSQPSQGTSVRVYLPALEKFVRNKSVKLDELGGTQTILMVDDEDLLLTMGQMVLCSYGYTVLTANNGHKALEIINREGGNIDLLITDLIMPNMSGRELIEHVRRVIPDARIISCSGYVSPASGNERTSYLQKPFTSQDLLRKVKQALDPESAS